MFANIKKVVFPLLPIVQTPNGPMCKCGGGKGCAGAGKHPATTYAELKLGDPGQLPEPGAGVGLKCGAAPYGSDIFVVDVDSAEADSWLHERGIPNTLTVLTGSGRGHQYYFRHPGFRVKTCAGELHPTIDIRGDGGMVVAPGSPHKSGGTYRIVHDTAPADAPAWLLEWLRANQGPAPRAKAKRPARTPTSVGGPVKTGDWLIDLASERGWLGRELKPGMFAVRCPNEDEHSGGGESGTVIFVHGALHCKHSHCAGMHRDHLAFMLDAWMQTYGAWAPGEEEALEHVLTDRDYVEEAAAKSTYELQAWSPPESKEPGLIPWKKPRVKSVKGVK